MNYHPLMGISIFFIAIIISFFLGRKLIKTNIPFSKIHKVTDNYSSRKKKFSPTKGEITSPDAPWLQKEDKNGRN